MDPILLILILVIIVVALFSRLGKHSQHTKKVFRNNFYKYTAKSTVMTPAEMRFFKVLSAAVEDRYYIFSQVHLSSLFDYRVPGQEWKYAFSHINGKSVDYVLCDRDTLVPTYGIELDDYSHDAPDRRDRDAEVERIFASTTLPLVRFKDGNVTPNEIIKRLTKAHKK